MSLLARTLWLAPLCAGSLAAACAQTPTPLATLMCLPPAGPALVEPVYQFELGSGSFSSASNTLVSDASAFADLFAPATQATVFPVCTLGGPTGLVMTNVVFRDDSLYAFGPGVLSAYDHAYSGAVTATYTSFCVASVQIGGGATLSYPDYSDCLPTSSGAPSRAKTPQTPHQAAQGGK